MGGKEGKFSVFIGFISGFLLLVAVVGGATNVSSCQVINQSGTYVLNTNITNGTVASCINITASDVILDGAGFRINGSGTGTYGVYVFSPTTTLTNVTVKNLNVTNWNNGIYYLNVQNGIIVNNTIENNYYGVYLSSSTGNTIYNNYFNNTNNAQDTGTNFWNATRTSGTNIVGGPYLGGNLWALPDGTGFSQNETACSDADEDGICDSNYTVSTGNVDYLPLVAPRVKIMINEIYYNTSGTDLTDEFIELYVWDDGWGDVNLSGYKITTFDGDNETLPDVSGLSKFGFVVIYMGSGTSDLNASDGNATIYLGRGSEMLDDAGDEVGLYDSEGNLIDFVRYGGGNGDGVSGGWSTGDAGITANNANESIQIHGPDLDNSSNWVSAHPTEGEPN
ncbi:NosD domain-containing protein, partial [Candidatus Pyrohabitans sp.]